MNKLIPFVDLSRQYKKYKLEIDDAISEVAVSGTYVMGPQVAKFEQELADLCGTKYAVAVGNGTDALIMALKTLGIGPGDEVITAPNSFVASAGAIAAVGADCVFVDVDEDHNIDANKIKGSITGKTKAILPVHLTGRPAAMAEIMEIAKTYRLYVIEDAAQAIGAELNGKRVGSLGHIGCFSLHPLKNIFVMGDGGFLTVSCPKVYQDLKQLQNHGLIDRDTAAAWGINSRLDTLHCAVGLVKLRHFTEITERYIEIANMYTVGLRDLVRVPVNKNGEKAVYHNYVIDCDNRDGLMSHLAAQNIETKIHYPVLLHLQPAARGMPYNSGDFPMAENLNKRQLSLPIFPELTDAEIDRVIKEIREFYL